MGWDLSWGHLPQLWCCGTPSPSSWVLWPSTDPVGGGWGAGRQLLVLTWHSTLAREKGQWKPNPCHDPISPTMAEPPLTGRGSQECGSSSASHIWLHKSSCFSSWKPEKAYSWNFLCRVSPYKQGRNYPKDQGWGLLLVFIYNSYSKLSHKGSKNNKVIYTHVCRLIWLK